MGKTKRSKTPGGNKVMTTMTANPLLPDAFDMSDVVALVSRLNNTIATLTGQIEKERKAHKLQVARLDKKASEDSKQKEELMRLVAELTAEIKKLREQNDKNPGNSNLPPSSQGYGKPPVGKDRKDSEKKSATRNTRSLRTKKGGHKGGQVVSGPPFPTRPMSSSISATSARPVPTCVNAWISTWPQRALREMNMGSRS